MQIRLIKAIEYWKKAIEIDDNYVGIWSKKIYSLQDSTGYDDSNLIRVLVIKLASKAYFICISKEI
ncbi:MAG: hypothetical protein WBL67_03470 [Nitrososphaeraceae archaeon]